MTPPSFVQVDVAVGPEGTKIIVALDIDGNVWEWQKKRPDEGGTPRRRHWVKLENDLPI